MFLLHAHSGVRYLLYLVGLAVIVYGLWGWIGKRPVDRKLRLLMFGFVGLIDLQILLGLALAMSRRYTMNALVGHVFLALGAAATAHVVNAVMRRRPQEEKTHPPYVIGAAIALVLLAGAILVLGRPLVG